MNKVVKDKQASINPEVEREKLLEAIRKDESTQVEGLHLKVGVAELEAQGYKAKELRSFKEGSGCSGVRLHNKAKGISAEISTGDFFGKFTELEFKKGAE